MTEDRSAEGDAGMQVQLSDEDVARASQAALENRARFSEHTKRFARPHERQKEAELINPATALVFGIYAEVIDPYGDGGVPPEASCIGRSYFAVDPDRGVAVSFYDLPEDTRTALQAERREADDELWRRLLRGMPDR
jgi:hypothetical protein